MGHDVLYPKASKLSGQLTPGDDELFQPIPHETLLAQGSLSEPDTMVVLESEVQADEAVMTEDSVQPTLGEILEAVY